VSRAKVAYRALFGNMLPPSISHDQIDNIAFVDVNSEDRDPAPDNISGRCAERRPPAGAFAAARAAK
jgi:hypothetical protein